MDDAGHRDGGGTSFLSDETEAGSTVRPAAPATLPTHDARALTRGGASALITLDGQIYQLRITRARKLILTK